ncbi:AzlD domain-containing protein [Ammoniphilus sp. CFH 90114]|nr:AzlD domain-containing protein [Ammoniphilus sp. CFH 90114]
MAAVTYFCRRAFLRLPNQQLSERLMSGLSYIPIGIFAGLIFPSVFVREGAFEVNPLYVIASILCMALMVWKKNVFLSFGLSLLFVVVWTTTMG